MGKRGGNRFFSSESCSLVLLCLSKRWNCGRISEQRERCRKWPFSLTAALTLQHGGSGIGVGERLGIWLPFLNALPYIPHAWVEEEMNANGCWFLLLLHAWEVGLSVYRDLKVALSLRCLVDLCVQIVNGRSKEERESGMFFTQVMQTQGSWEEKKILNG